MYLCVYKGSIPAEAGIEGKGYVSSSSVSRRACCCLSIAVATSSIPDTARSVPSHALRMIRDVQLTDSRMLRTDSGNRDGDVVFAVFIMVY